MYWILLTEVEHMNLVYTHLSMQPNKKKDALAPLLIVDIAIHILALVVFLLEMLISLELWV